MKLLDILGKAKKYITLAMGYLGKLLGLVKKAEEEFKKDSTEHKEEK